MIAEPSTDLSEDKHIHKTECVRHDGPWRGVDDLKLATASWVAWFNQTRRYSSLGPVPPIEYENTYYRHNATGKRLQPGKPSLH